ncbi:MAG TPA: phage tail sheath C-terminal domain-containing protein [Thermoanaerobaculia bacterium]|nr:phage tail sheath C-terminal domain-containing protein [Thermoanaerobaculia bacterium]
MSETIGEMILPGTYIEVRAEGLIGVGGIATGNVGVVGTANRGPVGQVQVLGSYSDALATFGSYDRWPDKAADQATALTLTRTLEQLFSGGASTVYAVRIANADVAAMSWAVESGTGTALFTLTADSPGTWANAISANLAAVGGVPTLTLVLGKVKETFAGATAGDMAQAITDGSHLVTVSGLATPATAPASVVASATPGGPDGQAAGETEVAAGLAALANQPVNIVAVGGLAAKDAAGKVLAHLEQTENDGRERIAVLGASSDDTAKIISDDVSKGSNPRLVLVAPGLVAADAARAGQADTSVKLPGSYAAALVAGRLATLAPHVSLTNKDVAADDLTTDYSRAQQKQLLGNQVLVLQKNLGIRVLKGITTDTGAFRQISVRRIVDYAKAGVRIGANPYIGRLNNLRVRAALKATLDGFLSGMVLDEMLTGYQLDVTATRAQEINGQAIVTMVLQPTFSIDFVKVIMNLE